MGIEFEHNITNNQVLTTPYTWSTTVTPQPNSVQFWADGNLLEHVLEPPFQHELDLALGVHDLGSCAYHGDVRTCQPPLPGQIGFARITVQDETPPEINYTYRFASFDTVDDAISGTLNRFQPAYSWWVPGLAEGTPWADNGGCHEIVHPTYGPGIRLRVTNEMIYPSPNFDSKLARFVWKSNEPGRPAIENFQGQEHIWEWTWMWPSAGNPGGWCQTHNAGEGLTFATTTSGAGSQVGHHLFFDRGASPLRVRFGRYLGGSSWNFSFGPIFQPDTYVHNRIEIKWTSASDGYIRVYTDSGSGYQQWVNYSGVTLPSNQNVWATYMNIRTPRDIATQYGPAWPHPNELDWINHRVEIL